MRYIILFLIIFSLASCAKKQPEAAWLKLDKWILETNEDAIMPQGELTHDLSQVFITMDGKSLGVYELPAKIPIIGDGKHTFTFMPGIIVNGISATKTRYPFAKMKEAVIELQKNDTVSHSLRTHYYTTTKFLIEDFESPSMQIDVSTQSTGTVNRNDDPAILKWGNKYGEIILTDEDSLVKFTTNFGEELPKNGKKVYLEFDYMNTNSALTGVISYGNDNFYVDPYLQINPQDKKEVKWKHIYVDLTENISYRMDAPINEAEFTFLKDYKGKESYFYIDNIKLIYP